MDRTSYQITRTNSKDVDEILEASDIINLYYSDQAALSGPTKYKYLNKSLVIGFELHLRLFANSYEFTLDESF